MTATVALFAGVLLFVLAAGGLFGFGVYRYLDSQRPKEGDHEYARAPLDLGNPPKAPPVAAPGDGVDASKDAPQKADAPPAPKTEPKTETTDPRPAAPTPPPADVPPPPKADPPTNPPVKADPPTPIPEDQPKPRPVDKPDLRPPDNPKPVDNPGPKPVDNPKPDAPPKPVTNGPKIDERLKPILAALKDKKAAVRQQALDDLGKLGDDGRPAAGAVCEIVAGDVSPAVRQSALDALDKIHPELSKIVVVLVVEADPLKHVKAVGEIGALGDDGRAAVPLLLTHARAAATRFQTSVTDVVSEDLRALALLAPDDLAAQKLIIEATQYTYLDPNVRRDGGAPVRLAAVQTLGELLRKNPEQAKAITPKLIAAAKAMTDAQARAQAITVLGTVAEGDADLRPQIAAGLLALLKAGDFNAIAAIAKCGRDAKDALPLLKQLKLNPEEMVRTAASDAITQIADAVASAGKPTPKDTPASPKNTDPPAKPQPAPVADDSSLPAELKPLVGRVKAGTAEDRVKATEELAAMADKAKPASRALCEAVLDSNQKVSHAALSALETINPDLKQPVFVILVDDKAPNHLEALGKLDAMGEDGRPAAPIVRQEIKQCLEQIGNNPVRWGNRILVQVIQKAMETLPKIAPDESQTVKSIIELTQFTSTAQFLTKKGDAVTNTPFRQDGIHLLGELAESQEAQRKQIVPPLVAVLKEGVDRTNGTDPTEVLQAIAQVDEAGDALLKCGPDGKDVLVKTVLPKLKDLQFNKSDQVRKTAEALQKKIEEGQ